MWTVNNNIKVRVVTPEGTIEEFFPGTEILRDVVFKIAMKYNYQNLTVKNNQGELHESEGDKRLSEVGELEIIPKTVGA